MKKLIVFALCAISTLSVFAEPFSNAKRMQFIKIKDWHSLRKYAYEAQVSNESNVSHMILYFNHLLSNKLTVEEINKQSQKFKVIGDEKYNVALGVVYANFNHVEQAIKIYNTNKSIRVATSIIDKMSANKQYDKALQFSKQINSLFFALKIYKAKRDWNSYWKTAISKLTEEGGYTNPTVATQYIHTMFRYKPSNITKEQQIEFLSKLAQIYPIPGTDFNQWKPFMGFVGYKYKALTGKDLF